MSYVTYVVRHFPATGERSSQQLHEWLVSFFYVFFVIYVVKPWAPHI